MAATDVPAWLGKIVEIMVRNDWSGHEWGIRSRIARDVGVFLTTIIRDFQHLLRVLKDEAYSSNCLTTCRCWRLNYGGCYGVRPGPQAAEHENVVSVQGAVDGRH